MLLHKLVGAAFSLSLSLASALAQSPQLGPGQLYANPTAAQRPGQATNLSPYFDRALGSVNGMIPYRSGGAWGTISTGTSGATIPRNDTANIFSATQTINPPAASLSQGLVVNQSGPASGSSVGPWSGNLINATFSSTVTGSANPFADFGAWQTSASAFRVNFTVGGGNLNGEPFQAGMFQTRVTSAAAPAGDGDFIGLIGQTYVNVVSTNSAIHGLAGGASVDTGASINVMNGLFSEVDVIGGTVVQRRGLSIASQATGTATGPIDAGIYIASSYPSGAFKKWAVFDTSAFQTNADLFWATGAQTVANVFNLSSMVVTGNILNFPSAKWAGSGALIAGAGAADGNTGAMVNASVASGGVAALISQVNSTTGFNGLHVNNSALNVGLFAAIGEPSSTATVFGQANAGWSEFVSSGPSNNGMLIGTLSTLTPVVFGTFNTERMRLLTGLSVGSTTDPGAGIVSALNGFVIGAAAKTLTLKQGANGAVGTLTCVSASNVTVSNTFVATNDNIIISYSSGTAVTVPAINQITGATSFRVACASGDTAVYNYAIIKNAA